MSSLLPGDTTKIYLEQLRKMNEMAVANASPEWKRLLKSANDAADAVEAMDKPQLKVYLVTVNPRRFAPHGSTHQEVVVLALDEESAIEATFKELQTYEPEMARKRTEVEEIKGPFTNGSVLHRS